MNMKFLSSTALFALLPLTMVGCTMAENNLKMDRELNTDMQDARDAFAPREMPAPQDPHANASGIPGFTDYMSEDTKNLKPMPLVSVSVNESIPLKDVLYELAQQAHYDLEIDPRIDGAIIFSAKNRPFDEVMSRIADLAGLRFKFNDDVVRVEIDTPYSETYKVDYLPMARTVSTTVQNNASFAGSGSSDGGSATSSSGSTFSLSGSTEVDFWKELDTNIKQILESNSLKNALLSSTTPTLSAPPVAAAAPAPAEGAAEGAEGQPPAEGSAAVATDAQASPPPAPAATPAATPATTPATDAAAEEEIKPTYSVNKQAGLLSVFANEKVHKKIKSYLDVVKKSVSSQVLIEAKVLEVSLSDEFAAGVNWTEIGNSLSDLNLGITGTTPGLSPATSNGFTAGIVGNDASVVISAVSRYGTVRALSSPRMTVLNKQSAVLNVATNQVYFEITQEPTSTDDGTTTGGGITVETKSVPVGVLVNMTPSIDPAKGEIVLNLRPTITRVEGTVRDPAPQLIDNAATVVNEIPQLSVQEFDSVLKVKSGEAVVMGGLIRDSADNEQIGVPILGEVPLIGSLFKSSGDKISKSEVIVFLKATIVNNGDETIHQTDRDMYKMYSRDRRPLPL